MGIKMLEARSPKGIVKVENYTPDYEPLTCKCCGIPVAYVSSYHKHIGEKERFVNCFFRRKTQIRHANDCDYEPLGRLRTIMASCAEHDYMTHEGIKYKVRLLLVTTPKSTIPDSNAEKINNRNSSDIQYVTCGNKSDYLSTMQSIMKLRAECETNNDLSNNISLQFLNVKDDISWNSFFYSFDLASYTKLYKKLNRKTVNALEYPVCVEGYVADIIPNPKFMIIKLECLKVSSVNEDDKRLSISYFVYDDKVREKLQDICEKKIVVYGQLKTNEDKEKDYGNGKRIIFSNVTGYINDYRQVYVEET